MAEPVTPTGAGDPKASISSGDFYTGKTAARSNYWFGFGGVLLAVIFGAFAIYTYVDGLAARDLQFRADSVSGEIVKVGQASGLSVTFKGEEILTDMSITQVVLWNAGKLPIKREHFLKSPAFITYEGKARILEASLRSVSREDCGVQLDSSQIAQGKLGLTWNILETGDGAVIQIIYAGSSMARAKLDAAIEGPRSNPTPAFLQARFWFLAATRWSPLSGIALMICLAIFAYVKPALADQHMSKVQAGIRLALAAIVVSTLVLLLFPSAGNDRLVPPPKLIPDAAFFKR